MIERMHDVIATDFRTKKLRSTIRDHLICRHVGRKTAASLHKGERKLVEPAPSDNLIRRLDDRPRDLQL